MNNVYNYSNAIHFTINISYGRMKEPVIFLHGTPAEQKLSFLKSFTFEYAKHNCNTINQMYKHQTRNVYYIVSKNIGENTHTFMKINVLLAIDKRKF